MFTSGRKHDNVMYYGVLDHYDFKSNGGEPYQKNMASIEMKPCPIYQ